MRKLFITLLCSTLLSTAASAADKLDPKYPAGLYLTATGIGGTEDEARKNALAELSKRFESEIYSETNDRIKAVIEPAGKSVVQDIESRVRVVSSVKLKGVEIAETWFDAKKKRYYAVAALDRRQARDQWLREIEAADMEIEGIIASIDSVSGKIPKLRRLYKALDLWVEREVLVSRMRVVGFTEGETPGYDMRAVFKAIPELKASLKIAVAAGGEGGKRLAEKVSEALGRNGYAISAESEADVFVTCFLDVKTLEVKDAKWKYARASARLAVKDPKTGIVLIELSGSKRAGHLTYAEASRKAAEAASGAVADELIKYLRQAE